jgi:pimeloyl-ACP methyl ester carboxylesterase
MGSSSEAPVPRNTYAEWNFDSLPLDVTTQPALMKTEDGALVRGVLYSRGGEKTVVCVMYTGGDLTRFYVFPALLEAGYATFGFLNRYMSLPLPNLSDVIHEALVADGGTVMRYLKEARGFQNVILLGNNAGSPLCCLYQSQAAVSPPGRLSDTAAGDPYDLNCCDLPSADGLILLSPYMGYGHGTLNTIDPSVTDESDPFSCDQTLDMYSPLNGFREPPQQTKYSQEFLQRYRHAQRMRTQRLDAIARNHISIQRACRALGNQSSFAQANTESAQFVNRRAVAARMMIVHRQVANPASLDPTIDPSDRVLTSAGAPAIQANYTSTGFFTPRSWLSTYSPTASRALTIKTLPELSLPMLIIYYAGTSSISPSDVESIYRGIPALDKSIERIPNADHRGNPAGREQSTQAMIRWLRERYP